MTEKFIPVIFCVVVVAFVFVNSSSQPHVNKRHVEAVGLDSLALKEKLSKISKLESPNSILSRFHLDLPADSKSEFELQSFDGYVDIIGSVAFSNAEGEQVLLPRKFLSNVRLCSISDEEERYEQRGYGIEPLVARNKKWELSLSGNEADNEKFFNSQRKWIRGACWVSNSTRNDVPNFDASEPGLVTTRKVWVAKRNLYPWQGLSGNDVCLEERKIPQLPSGAASAFVDVLSAECSLSWYTGIEADDVIRSFYLRFPSDAIPCVNFQTGPLLLGVVNVVVDFEQTPFNASPMPRRWDVVGEFYKSPLRLIQGAKAKRVVARNARIFNAALPYSHYPNLDDDSTTIVGLLMDDIEKSKYVAARKIQSGNFWLVPTGSTSYGDLFEGPPGLDEHVRNIYATRSPHVSTQKVLVANRDLKIGDSFDEYNLYVCDVPESYITDSMPEVESADSFYGREVKRAITRGEILNPDSLE